MDHPSTSFYTYSFPDNIILNHVEVSKISNTVYVCGKKSNGYPFLAKSTDNGRNYTIILDGSYNPNEIGELYHMSIYYEGNNEVLMISGNNKLAEYRNSFIVLNSSWGTDVYRKISFSDSNNGFFIENNTSNDNPPVQLSLPSIWKTTNGGMNWSKDYEGIHTFSNADRFYSFGSLTYFLENPSTTSYQGIFHSRKLKMGLYTYCDNVISAGIIKINNYSYPTSNSQTYNNISGGSFPLWTNLYLNQPEKIFYKWSFNRMTNSIPNFDYFYDGVLAARYKTKLAADNDSAIANANQTKALRDTNGTIHLIHESIGGIFYTRSNDNGETFQNEEIVNAGTKWNADFPNDVSSSENKSPTLCEIRNILNGRALSIDFPYESIAAAWQHYNTQNGKMEIRVASRVYNGNGSPDWYKYGLTSNWNGVLSSFPAGSSFLAKPVILASTSVINGFHSEPNNHLLLVPHLEPSTNDGYKIVVTARYQNCNIYPSNNNPDTPYDFIIADGNSDGIISDYSVTAEPSTFYTNIYNGYTLHFSYKRENKIVYKKALISLASIGGSTFIRWVNPNVETETIISDGDDQLIRNTPDITLRNGRPAITYRGYKIECRPVVIENGSDEPQIMITPHYPVIVKCMGPNGWESGLHYDGLSPQENPNIEGSKNADAYLLNFRKNNANYQFVKVGNASGYKCSPGISESIDAKLVKNSYLGQLGSGAGPLLLKLSYPDENNRFLLSRQPFSILPSGIETDGFSNLDGVIEKDNTLYSLTLGPIIASNTTYGFEDDTPPQTVQNPVEFNETMVSAVFTLSNYDTLILGANGKYTTSFTQAINPLKYHVNLVNASSGQIHRELFRDTIKTEDSVGIEYLRGYVINNIDKGTDQFYIQMVVDTLDAKDGNYDMAGVYADCSSTAGDAPRNFKTKVFFENSSNSLTSGNQIPKEYSLSQNYPNPFNPSTTIKYSLPKDGYVSLKIYDITGREVKSLANEVKKAGYYSVTFNASNLASGVYFYRIQSNDFVQTKRMVLIK